MVDDIEDTDMDYLQQVQSAIFSVIKPDNSLSILIDTLMIDFNSLDSLLQNSGTQAEIDTVKSHISTNYASYLTQSATLSSTKATLINNAQTTLSNVTGTEDIVETHHDTYEIVLDYLENGYNLSSSDSSYLQTVGNLCPNDYGYPIYLARSILNVENSFTFNDTINCILPQNRSVISEKEDSFESDIYLSPNPSNGVVYINNFSQKVKIRITDVNGAEILGKSELNSLGRVDLPSNIIPGIYYVYVYNNDELTDILNLVYIK